MSVFLTEQHRPPALHRPKLSAECNNYCFIAGSPFFKSPLDSRQIRIRSGLSREKDIGGGFFFTFGYISNDMSIEGLVEPIPRDNRGLTSSLRSQYQ